MNYKNFTFDRSVKKIAHKKSVFFKTSSGKSWKTKPDAETVETVSAEFYENFVKSVSFFNGFMGGTCRAQHNYTKYGFLPVVITTVNPDRSEKHIDVFYFE